MAYTPPRPTPVGKAWQSARLQGLLGKGRGQGLFGPNIRQDGVGLDPGRRNTLIAPNPAATGAMGSAINRLAPRGAPTPAPTSPRVMNTGGAKVSDIFKGAKLGQFGARVGQPAAPSPLAGYGQFGPQAAETQAVQGVQGSTNILQSATDLANAQAQRPTGEEGPGAILDPAQSFLSRMVGEKGSGKRSDIGRSMMQAGARMMQGSPDGTFATIGQGLEAGLGGYQALKEDRRVQEDRAIKAEDRATMLANRDTAQAGVDAAVVGLSDTQAAAVQAMFAEGKAGEALELAEVYSGRTRYEDAINSLGGKWLTPDQLQVVLAKPEAEGFGILETLVMGAPAKQARAQALVNERGWTMEDALLAAEDAQATDAILRGQIGTQVVMSQGKGYLIDKVTGETLEEIGESDMPLRWAQLEAMESEAEVAGQSELMGQVVGDYNTFRPDVDALEKASEALDILHSGDIGESSFNHVSHFVGKLVKSEEAIQLGSLENILKEIGIGNLSMFVGAISERELAEALSLAGNITDMHATLNDILARNMEGTLKSAEDHNRKVATLEGSGVTLANQWAFDQADLDRFQEQAEVARAAGGLSMLDQSPTYQMNMQRRGVQQIGAGQNRTYDPNDLTGSAGTDADTAGLPDWRVGMNARSDLLANLGPAPDNWRATSAQRMADLLPDEGGG